MKKLSLLLLLPLVLLALPSPSLAVVELGLGINNTFFQGDLDGVDSGTGTSVDLNLGSGTVRLMLALQSSDHDQGDYKAWMAGPSFTLDMEGFTPRIYALLSGHEFERLDGTGITLGGGVDWPMLPAVSLGLDFRYSQWEGNGYEVGTGAVQVLFRIGF